MIEIKRPEMQTENHEYQPGRNKTVRFAVLWYVIHVIWEKDGGIPDGLKLCKAIEYPRSFFGVVLAILQSWGNVSVSENSFYGM